MAEHADIRFTLNGRAVHKSVAVRSHVADMLRLDFGLTGTHLGCEHGVCGACHVRVNGVVVRGCLMLAVQVNGATVDTIEGMTAAGELATLQASFVRHNALQCGFCTSGMLLAAWALLSRQDRPDDAEIREALSGNICRCTGYEPIVAAVADVRAERPGGRPDAMRLASGRGRYVDDLDAAGLLHVAFLRSPHARARIVAIDGDAARRRPGIVAVLTGADLAAVCAPWRTTLAALPDHASPLQSALALGEATWQGEPVAAVVAQSRAEAEDALDDVVADWEECASVTDAAAALRPAAAPVHAGLAHNLAIARTRETGDVAAAFAAAAFTASQRFGFARQTGVTLEPRGILASYDARMGELVVQHSHQAPFQMREILAAQLGLAVARVRVVCPDVGGAFGLKLHTYPDEVATAAISVLLGRPVKFVADRLESFVSDAQARDATADASIAADRDGRILAITADLLFGFGPVSCHPRGSVGEALQALDLCGAPYMVPAFQGRVRGAYLNKPPTGAYRAVGQPIACGITEQLLDLVAQGLGIDPAEVRRRNLAPADVAVRSPGGLPLGRLSMQQCLATMLDRMAYDDLRREQKTQQTTGIFRGLGLAAFVEMTGVGSGLYGPNKVRVSAQEAVRLALAPGGVVLLETSVTEQGQGTRFGLAQVAAEVLGVAADGIVVAGTDTGSNPYGGGAWASRGMALGGEAALKAARILRARILAIAGAMLQADPADLHLAAGAVCNAAGMAQLSFAELADAVHFLPDAIPLEEVPALSVEQAHVPRNTPWFTANGVQAAYVEVDVRTGQIRVLGFWVVEDCGRVVNARLVDGQIRGGVVQGLGAALFEACSYSASGQLQNGSLAEYLVPMACEMPRIDIAHVSTPERSTELGAKGAGEAGTVAAAAAIRVAVNDALRPLGVRLEDQPFTPERVLAACRWGSG